MPATATTPASVSSAFLRRGLARWGAGASCRGSLMGNSKRRRRTRRASGGFLDLGLHGATVVEDTPQQALELLEFVLREALEEGVLHLAEHARDFLGRLPPFARELQVHHAAVLRGAN